MPSAAGSPSHCYLQVLLPFITFLIHPLHSSRIEPKGFTVVISAASPAPHESLLLPELSYHRDFSRVICFPHHSTNNIQSLARHQSELLGSIDTFDISSTQSIAIYNAARRSPAYLQLLVRAQRFATATALNHDKLPSSLGRLPFNTSLDRLGRSSCDALPNLPRKHKERAYFGL